jgi:hypothetical protein
MFNVTAVMFKEGIAVGISGSRGAIEQRWWHINRGYTVTLRAVLWKYVQ